MKKPCLVYADADGNIFDHPGLAMAGSAGGRWETVDENQCIPLPEGSELFLLPGRLPVGVARGGDFEVMDRDPVDPVRPVSAVAAFMAPAHTATLNAAFHTTSGAPNLPLFSYAALGFHEGRFVAAGIRVDPLPRQDPGRFPSPDRITSQAKRLLRENPQNRLWQHLGTCALTFGCPAAKNLMLGRWEAPLPTSPACNASCLGCLNDQPAGRFPCTQERMKFTPSAREVTEVALYHLRKGRDPLVSLGLGCVGERLLLEYFLAVSINLIRKKRPSGSINLNTNGSKPEAVARLMREGLSSIRVSVNSLIPERHQAYYQPRGWSLKEAIASIEEVKKAHGHASINLLTMPGVTDRPEEVEALFAMIERTSLDLIQWRNLNIDPEVYVAELGLEPPEERMGIEQLISELKRRFPRLKHGYYNPKLD